jgi:UDP-N-acetylmuramoyl-tripeptide--D-alanyl-D-alanine ligase
VQLVEPQILVITNIIDAHLGNFNSLEELAGEKMSAIESTRVGGTLVYHGDSRYSCEMEQRGKKQGLATISVGGTESCEFRLERYEENPETNTSTMSVKAPSGPVTYSMRTIGRHYAELSAIALAVIHALGFDIMAHLKYFSEFEPIPGRGQIVHVTTHDGKTFDVMDDAYNASPAAMHASLETVKSLKYRKKISLLGQMLELGVHEERFHDEIARHIATVGLAEVFFVGPQHLWPIMNRYREVTCFEKIGEEVIMAVLKTVEPGALVHVKASRGIKLDQFVTYVKESTPPL